MSTSNDLPLATWDVPLRAGVQSPCPSPWLCSSLALKDILACPVCAAQQFVEDHEQRVGSFLLCEGCGAVYPLRHGVPNFIPPSALLALPDDLLAAWQITQQEALPDYRANDPASCSVPARDDVQRVRQLMDLRGKSVLDIGSGVFQLPGYVDGSGYGHYVGIDPLAPEGKPCFSLLTGIAEMLPFRAGSFDVVILATSLDHVLRLPDTLAAVRRVLRPHGSIYFWGGGPTEFSALDQKYAGYSMQQQGTPRFAGRDEALATFLAAREQLAARTAALAGKHEEIVPLLADRYHFRHISRRDLLVKFTDFGFQPLYCEDIVTSGIVNGFFYHLRYADAAARCPWNMLTNVPGDGSPLGSAREDIAARVAKGLALWEDVPQQLEELPGLSRQVAALQDVPRQLAALQDIVPQVAQLRTMANDFPGRFSQFQGEVARLESRLEAQTALLQTIAARLEQLDAARRSRLRRLLGRLLAPVKRGLRAVVRTARGVRAAVVARWKPAYASARKLAKYARVIPTIAVAKCLPRPRKPTGGRRVLMLTISQIDVDPRINKAARTLVAAGYTIDILSLAINESLPGARPVDEPAYAGVTYVRVPRRANNHAISAMYQPEFVEAAADRDFDYVHANDLPTLMAAWVISRRRGVPLVYDAHEIWSENVLWDGTAYRAYSWRRRWAMRLTEGFLLKNVDLFLSVSPSICVEYQRRHKLRRPPLLLPNVPELAMLRQCDSGTPSIRELCGLTDEHFITLYLGGVNPARNIERVVEAHRYLPENYVFVIRGPGIEYYGPEYVKLAESLGIHGRVFALPAVDKDRLLDGAAGADCGIVMLRNICRNFYWFYPNKFFEYMLAKIPIAVSNFPDVTAHIERERCGVTFDPDDPRSIAAALERLGRDRAEARAMGLRGFEGVRREYHWEAASRPLVEAYARLTQGISGVAR